MSHNRLLGHYKGAMPGPLIIAIGQMHGNEPAGTEAIKRMFLEIENQERHESSRLTGSLVGVLGNRSAATLKARYISRDMNRIWDAPEDEKPYDSESIELHEMRTLLKRIINADPHERIIIVDLHTFSAGGGCFCIPGKTEGSVALADQCGAPVIMGLLDKLSGTALHYFNQETTGKPTVGLAFEGGRHDDPVSSERCFQFLRNVLIASGFMYGPTPTRILEDPEIPKHTKLVYRHPVAPKDNFEMMPGFVNFQSVNQGQRLATDRSGAVLCPQDGYILMPLYQKQGADGFFILEAF